jgi:hypothetical protein
MASWLYLLIMMSASRVLTSVPNDFVPVEVLGFGAIMLVAVMLIHGSGLGWITDWHERGCRFFLNRKMHPRLAASVFATTILMMLALHIIETLMWGLALNKAKLVASLRDSIYFSANTYTTIGYGKMILPENWRELAPIMAISGLFAFAWTTGEMFNVIGVHRKFVSDLWELRKGNDQTARAASASE